MYRVTNYFSSKPPKPPKPVPPVQTPKKADPVRSKRAVGDLLPRLAEATTKDERDLALHNHVEAIFQDSLSWPTIKLPQFASFHLQSFLQGDRFATGSTSDGVQFWLNYLSLWQLEKGSIIPFGVSLEQLKSIHHELETYHEFLSLIKLKNLHTDSNDAYVLETATLFQTKLQQHLTNRQRCYLPLGYRGGLLQYGHAIPVLFEEKDEIIVAHIINKGEGAERHPQMNWSATQDFRSIRYPPIHIEKKVLFGPLGFSFLARQIELLSINPESHPPYESQDLYGALLIIGKLQSKFDAPLSAIEGKMQFGRVCADMASRLVVIDHLQVCLKGCPKERNRMLFNAKFCSLVRLSHELEYELGVTATELFRVLEESHSELCVATNERGEKRLNSEEVVLCHAILERIKQKILIAKQKLIKPLRRLPFKVAEYNTSFPFSPNVVSSEKPLLLPHETISIEEIAIPSVVFTPNNFIFALQSWNRHLEFLSSKTLDGSTSHVEALDQFALHAVDVLPIPSMTRPDEWDKIPRQHIEGCILELKNFLALAECRTRDTSPSLFFPTFLMLHTVYAIMDRLARKLPEARLNGFFSPYMLNDLSSKNNQFSCLLMGRDSDRLSKIEEYFRELRAVHLKRAFYFDDVIFLGLELSNRNPETPKNGPLGESLDYLGQFAPLANDKRLLVKTSEELYASLFLDPQILPPAVSALRTVAFATYTWVANKDKKKFTVPSNLSEEYKRHAGKIHLVITGPNVPPRPREYDIENSTQWTAFMNEQLFTKKARNDVIDHRLNIPLTGRKSLPSANTAFCLPSRCGVKDLSAASFRELQALRCIVTLRIVSITAWGLTHLVEFENPLVQALFVEILFAPGALLKQLREEPELVKPLRKLINEGIDTYQKNQDADLFLYFVSVGYFIETHVLEACEDTWQSEQQITAYRQYLDLFASLSPVKGIGYYRLLTYLHYKNPDASKLQEIIDEEFRLTRLNHFLPPSLFSLGHRFDQLWQRVQINLRERDDNPFVQRLCGSLLQDCEQDVKNEEGIWRGTYPLFSKGSYLINFTTKMVSKDRIPFLNPVISGHSLNRHLQSLIDPSSFFTWKEGYFESSNNRIRLFQKGRGYRIQQKFMVNGKVRWYQLSLKYSLLWCGRETMWRGVDWDVRDDYLLTDRKPRALPFAQISHSEGARETRLDKDGNFTELQLINTKSYDCTSEWFKTVTNMGSKDYFRCYINTKTNLIELVEFLDLSLTFRGEQLDEKWILRCDQYPSYFIAEEQELLEIPDFFGLLVLENSSGEKIAIVPDRSLDIGREGFLLDIRLRPSLPAAHFLFEVSGGKFYSDAPKANAMMTVLCAKLGRYEDAFFYLSRCRSYHASVIEACESAFENWEDWSPSGLAFLLHVAVYSLKERNLLTRDRYQNKHASVDFEFWKQIPATFVRYLRVLGADHNHGSVPQFIRLPFEDEQLLLTYIQKHLIENPNTKRLNPKKLPSSEWSHLLENRLRLLHEPDGLSLTIGQQNLQRLPVELTLLETNPSSWLPQTQQLLNMQNMIRIKGDLSNYVLPLLAVASTVGKEFPAPFDLDLFYLMRSVAKKDRSTFTTQLLTVLTYVRHFPERFTHLDLQSQEPDCWPMATHVVSNMIEEKIFPPAQCVNIYLTIYIPKKDLTLTLPQTKLTSNHAWPISAVKALNSTPTFSTLREQLFHKNEIKKDLKRPFYLDDKVLIPETEIEKRLYKQLKDGFLENAKTVRFAYVLKGEFAFSDLRREQERMIQIGRTQLIAFRAQIEALANWMPEDQQIALPSNKIISDYLRRIRYEAKVLPLIKLDDQLIDAYLTNDIASLKELNPHLSDMQFTQLHSMMKQYLGAAVGMQQTQDIINCLLKIEASSGVLKDNYTQRLGRLLDQRMDESNPVLETYQYRAKKRLTPQQSAIICWIIDSLIFCKPSARPVFKALLFAFEAGGGKTSVLLPILLQIARSRGFFSISIVPTALYNIEKHNQNSTLQNIFNLSLAVLELGLEDQVTGPLWKQTHDALVDDHKAKRALIMEPNSYHALYLHYLLALEQKNIESVRWLSRIVLDFFPKKAIAFIDESPRNVDPLVQTNLGIGIPQTVPAYLLQLLLECYYAILDYTKEPVTLDDGRTLGQVLRLTEGQQASTKPHDLQLCKIALATYMISHPLLDLSEKDKTLFLPYLLDNSLSRPPELTQMHKTNRERAELISLLRGFFTEYFEFTMSQVSKNDHGPSLLKSEPFQTPRDRTAPSLCQYEDPFVTASISIQEIFQQPKMTLNQVTEIVNKLRSLHSGQKRYGEQRYAELFQKWTDQKHITLEMISTEKWKTVPCKSDQKLIDVLAQNREAKEWYLKQILFPAITYVHHHLTSTARHLAHGFNAAVLFTATPGIPEQNFLTENDTNFKSDHSSLDMVVNRYCCEPIDQVIFAERNPVAFFNEIANKKPNLFPACCAMIDPENALRSKNSEIAKAFLLFAMQNKLPYDGVLYYQDADKLDQPDATPDTLIFMSSLHERPIQITGGDVETAFPKHGLNWQKMRVMVLFDASHTLAANIPLPLDASILYVLAENLTLSNAIQAQKRDRQFTERRHVVAAIPSYLVKTIPKDEQGELSPKAQTFWTLKNQATKVQQTLISNAYQEIEYLVQQTLIRKLKQALHDPEKQIALFHQYGAGIKTPYILSPYERFSSACLSWDSSKVLVRFAQNCYNRYGYDTPWSDCDLLQKQVNEVINYLSPLVPTLPNRSYRSTGQGTHLHALHKQEAQQHQTDRLNLVAVEPALNVPDLHAINFLSQFIRQSQPAQSAFKCTSLSPNLYYTKNALKCASSNGKELGITYLRPVDFLLIVKQGPKNVAFALSPEEAHTLKTQLLSTKNGPSEHQALLVSIQGWIAQQASGTLQMDHKTLLASPWFEEVIADASLIHGQFRFHHSLLERLPQWPDFNTFWHKVTTYHPHPERIETPPTGPLYDAVHTPIQRQDVATPQPPSSLLGSISQTVLSWWN